MSRCGENESRYSEIPICEAKCNVAPCRRELIKFRSVRGCWCQRRYARNDAGKCELAGTDSCPIVASS